MEKGEFQKIEKSNERMYGPRKLLVCGYPEEEQSSFLSFLDEIGFQDLPVIFLGKADSLLPLAEILSREGKSGFGEPSDMKRAVIMSGFSRDELHNLISAYKQTHFPEQLWAALTPVSESWAIGYLLEELANEAAAMRKRK